MRDDDDRLALFPHGSEDLEKLFYFLRGEDRRRFIKDQYPGAAVESLQNLYALLLPDRQIGDASVQIDFEPEISRELTDHLFGLIEIDPQSIAWLRAQN